MMVDNKRIKVWYAASSLITRMGPFASDVDAWRALRSAINSGRFVEGCYVWPEWKQSENGTRNNHE
jgi:hypothetical protein